MKGARSKRYSSYRYRVGLETRAVAPSRSGFTRDHIVPVSFGFKHDLPPERIGSLENIQYIGLNENIQKGQRMTPEALNILDSWALRYPELKDLAEATRMKHEARPE